MFGIPGEIFWPTAAFGALILLVFGAIAALRYLPPSKSRQVGQADPQALETLQGRLDQLDQLQERVSELEERVDFAERLIAKRREGERLALPRD
ncbi:MAG: hypothetical protein ACREMJ_11470 [Gemmatimonadales bacterium]